MIVNIYLSGFCKQEFTAFNFDGRFTTCMCKQCKTVQFCGWRTLMSSLLSISFSFLRTSVILPLLKTLQLDN